MRIRIAVITDFLVLVLFTPWFAHFRYRDIRNKVSYFTRMKYFLRWVLTDYGY